MMIRAIEKIKQEERIVRLEESFNLNRLTREGF